MRWEAEPDIKSTWKSYIDSTLSMQTFELISVSPYLVKQNGNQNMYWSWSSAPSNLSHKRIFIMSAIISGNRQYIFTQTYDNLWQFILLKIIFWANGTRI